MSSPPTTLAGRVASRESVDPSVKALAERMKATASLADPDKLPATVASASERRCPFLTTYSEVVDDQVDATCDVRVQTFTDTPPFGPQDLTVCERCLMGKSLQLSMEQSAMAEDMAEQASKEPPPPSEDARRSAR